ncbi:MAG: 3-hydroxybutyryl-CoA dehydrogenase [Bacteroidetes bacterium RIFCSPLOWO2_02_FULL_36_8]|nr:MAG: 3-hydroxybutyryl-CoA dehydrogenase [Bacteroidetes bacterium RIFCSPLOWO2_02_FULL_36_8]OFY69977.1 MAG: 3-hydroxybutyryl-CoA dehydrogenase [Bacteroidetes bacterium RIFCSPLOWO2_12_FULL_37_12]
MKNITIIGAGTMGNGIAHVFALNNFNVSLIDTFPGAIEKAKANILKNLERQVLKNIITSEQKENTLKNISWNNEIEKGLHQPDLVIEAINENPELKLKLFKLLDEKCLEHTILASNTSSISITRIGAATKRPEKVIGMHFMNPVPVMKLVEIIKGYSTSTVTTKTVMELSKQLGKIPVEVNDYPGFISNRILLPMLNEAIQALFEGVAGVQEIDTVMKLGMAHPMGPLQLADFIGLDVCIAILNVLYDGLGNQKYAPCPLLVNMVNAGHLGVKTGCGFYNYSGRGKELVVAGRFEG